MKFLVDAACEFSHLFDQAQRRGVLLRFTKFACAFNLLIDFDPFAALGFSGNFNVLHITADRIRKFFHRLITMRDVLVHRFLADLDHSRVDIRPCR